MSYEFYKVLHLLGLFMTFTGLTVILIAHWTKSESAEVTKPVRILGSATHGVGLVLTLVGGFGLAARLGLVTGLPTWIYIKLTLWLIAGGLLSAAKRKAKHGLAIYTVMLVIFTLGAWIAVNKPF